MNHLNLDEFSISLDLLIDLFFPISPSNFIDQYFQKRPISLQPRLDLDNISLSYISSCLRSVPVTSVEFCESNTIIDNAGSNEPSLMSMMQRDCIDYDLLVKFLSTSKRAVRIPGADKVPELGNIAKKFSISLGCSVTTDIIANYGPTIFDQYLQNNSDIYVIQLCGIQNWNLHPPVGPPKPPTFKTESLTIDKEMLTDYVTEKQLPGAALYIPSGWIRTAKGVMADSIMICAVFSLAWDTLLTLFEHTLFASFSEMRALLQWRTPVHASRSSDVGLRTGLLSMGTEITRKLKNEICGVDRLRNHIRLSRPIDQDARKNHARISLQSLKNLGPETQLLESGAIYVIDREPELGQVTLWESRRKSVTLPASMWNSISRPGPTLLSDIDVSELRSPEQLLDIIRGLTNDLGIFCLN